MTNRPAPALSKWIFVLTDILLLIGFAWTVHHVLPPKNAWDYATILTVAVLWMVGAWICIKPWLEEFRAQNKHLENETLASAVEQIQKLEEVASRVQTATSSWQAAHDAATRTAAAAREIEEKIRNNTKEFMDFTTRVDNEEKKHMSLEIEKLRRGEAEWLQVTARMLDHTYLLMQAGQRSGQANLINQLQNFQNAQRDSVRRMGMVPYMPTIGEEFNSRVHQTETPDTEPPAGSVVNEVLATGFTYQSQILRRSLVRVISPQSERLTESQPTENQPAPQQPSATTSTETAPEPTPRVEIASSEPTLEAAAVLEEVALAETPAAEALEAEPQAESQIEPEQPLEPEPRRRSRKPDPQSSLPL